MKDVKQNYNMSHDELTAFSTNVITAMTRDNVEFTGRSVTVLMRTAFETLVSAFELFPPDEEYLGLIKIEVDAKNILRAAILIKIQSISGFFEQKWGLDSGEYKRLAIAGIQNISDETFLHRARDVARVAEDYLTELQPLGLTQLMIDALETDAGLFDDKLKAIGDKRLLRDTKTEERTTKGNEIYSYLTEYCKVGKLIWENINYAKYEDYIIYKTSYPGLPKPQNVLAAWNPGDLAITLSWDLVLGATKYEVFYSIVAIGAPSGNYNLLNTFTTSPQQIPFTNNKRNYFKIKAKNDTQTSDYSDEAWVDCA